MRGRVMLVTPPYHCGMVESAGVWMPLGLAYLSGSLKSAGYDPEIYDAMSLFHDLAHIERRIETSQPDVVAVTAQTPTMPAALAVLAAARRAAPEVVTVIGGVHPTHMADEALGCADVDYVVRGEGERALPELLDCLAAGDVPSKVPGLSFRQDGRVVHTADRPLCADLDALPIDWDGIDWPTYHYRTKPGSRLAIASWARGCNQGCSFCSQRKLWRGTWRARSVEGVVSEVKMLATRYGVDTLEVADEYPTLDRARWERILDRLIEEDLGVELLMETRADDVVRDEDIIGKYREAGILHTYVGVESPRQDRLDWMGKGLKVEESRRAIDLLNEAGIITETSFLFGHPDDTRESVAESIELAMTYSPDLAFFLAITPWPFADMYAEVADRVEEHDYARYNLINPIIRPDGMSREELAAMLSHAFARFYMGKMRSMEEMPPHKREYMRRVSKLLVEGSYLAAEVAGSLAMMACAHAKAPAENGGEVVLEAAENGGRPVVSDETGSATA